ncbi:MAG TPA: ectonucleotide pyrophosphatase/phosphodiesterase [Rhodothermales bacterium]|nr:ectonucleotide pyrophosphatase/phosphodiesterase [Rhodothermales bacterium]
MRHILWITLLAWGGCKTPATLRPVADAPTPLILISLDGFRSDYWQKTETPALRQLVASGVRAEWMTPSFPSKTFPNHYTLVTGLYPDHHGIINNTMYDSTLTEVFSLSNRKAVIDPRWWGGEPIWVTAQKQGKRSGVMFWPGSEAPIKGIHPTFWKVYEHEMPGNARVDTLLAWLDLPQTSRPHLFTLYFSTTDDAGHRYGPDAPETEVAIREVDGYLARLLNGLAKRGLTNKVNLVITSDHGMMNIDKAHVVQVDQYVDMRQVARYMGAEIGYYWPKTGKTDSVYQALKRMPHAQTYKKEALPKRFHFGSHPRVSPIVSISDEGWMQMTTEQFLRAQTNVNYSKGAHGHDNALASMRATFIAYGPAFKKGQTVAPFDNIHLYALLCHLLEITPAPNDGQLAAIRSVLRKAP